jgi:hypothetical protein
LAANGTGRRLWAAGKEPLPVSCQHFDSIVPRYARPWYAQHRLAPLAGTDADKTCSHHHRDALPDP